MTALNDLRSRDGIGAWLTANNLLGDAVEIGVYDGANAAQILSTWQGRLILIDPWKPQDKSVYIESQWIDFPAVARLAIERMLPFGKRAVFKSMTSDEAFAEIGDVVEQLDFCYIDGNHAAEQVRRDIVQWWTLVKPGGVLGGHDYMDTPELAAKHGHCCGVKPSVDAFAELYNLPLHITHDEPPSWWLQKPI